MRLIDADKLSSEMEFVFENARGMTALAARLVWAFIEKADTVDVDLIDREKAVKEIEETISAMMNWRIRNLDQEKGLYDAITIIEGLSSVKPQKDD